MKTKFILWLALSFVYGLILSSFIPAEGLFQEVSAFAASTVLCSGLLLILGTVKQSIGSGAIFSALPAGDFSCANLLQVLGRAQELWQDAAFSRDYVARVQSLIWFLNAQSGRVRLEALKGYKDREYRLYWPNACDIEVTDCGNDCDPDLTELSAGCQDYALTTCKQTGFKIARKKLRENEFNWEEQVALGILKSMNELDQFWNRQLIATLDANAGVNADTTYTDGGQGYVIPSSLWNLSLMPYFIDAIELNNFANGSALISGKNLSAAAMLARFNAGNDDGKGNAALADALTIVKDLWNVDQVTGEKSTFLISPGAAAVVTKAYYTDTPEENKQDTRYSVASMNLPGVRYDVIYKNYCENNEIYDSWLIQTKGDVLINPTGCNPDNVGILKFICQ